MWTFAQDAKDADQTAAKKAKPALTVTLATPKSMDWPNTLSAQGNIAAWQEAVIGAEIGGYRITEVTVDVGDAVKKGQLLARIATDTVNANVAQARASVAEAEAALAEAKANAANTRDLNAKGFSSSFALTQAETAEQSAKARLDAARARLQLEEVHLTQTRVLAPDDGIISSRTATVGSLSQPGQELFRLIRGNRLEWRAEVTAAEAERIRAGMAATLHMPSGAKLKGTVRAIAPTVDAQTRTAIVYVDLPKSAASSIARAGTFARGEFELGRAKALTVPQSAVLLREGFAYVFLVGENNVVGQTKVTVGRRVGDRIEITSGLAPTQQFAAMGAGFLADGDTVRVVDTSALAESTK
jgi:RND family efflux transporter MFP subunit